MSSPIGPWAAVDPLGQALHFLRMSGAFYCRSEFSAPWGLTMPPMDDCLMFHVLLSGRARVEVGEDHCEMQAGDLVLVPHGRGHRLLDETSSPAPDIFELERKEISAHYELLNHGAGGATSVMMCGAVRFEHPAARHLLEVLPKLVHVDVWNASEAELIQSTVRLMSAEAKQMRPGGETVMTRLSDILVIQAIRSWLASAPPEERGWLRALADPNIGRAMLLIQQQPGRPWSVASLAKEVAMSRSAFSARFAELVGESPMRYVSRWRMFIALTWLREENAALSEIASRLGYQSDAAFSRAFKKTMGMSPGAARRTKAQAAA